ncbi:hypothetical protein PV04_08664 [Phialophora macrospora]|uniref:Uncharacterized protein n=1 Tax=Phialophora macrospora TaxID=1851006 RepID=A0A0D2CEZ5_9EURO|nr:hypothetical protein PV04_08664 [Phialophora macrospora]
MSSAKSKLVSHSVLSEPVYNPCLAGDYRFNMSSFPGLRNLTNPALDKNDINLDAKAMGFKMTEKGVITSRFQVSAKEVDSWQKNMTSKGQRAIANRKTEVRASYVQWSQHLKVAGHKDVTEDLMDIDSPAKPERQYWDHPMEWMESKVRPEVAARELRKWRKSKEAWTAFQKEMAAFSNPFGVRQCLQDELSALLRRVYFKGSPVKNVLREQGPDMAQLPYPLCEAAFLEEFVTPLFEMGEDWSQATLLDRLVRSEDMAVEVLAIVDAVEKEWQKLAAGGKKGWLTTVCIQEFSPGRAFAIYKLAYQQLRKDVEREAPEQGNCVRWRCRRAVALLRAERMLEDQLKTKPIMADLLPVPVYDRAAAARSLLAMLERPAS